VVDEGVDVSVLIEPKLDLPRLAEVLDGFGHEGRLRAVMHWNRAMLAALYEALAGFRPIAAADFVPAGTPPRTPIIHHGKNSLPLFSHFQKRFCRGDGAEEDVLWGYNEQTWGSFTGPGYFTARAEGGPGEVVIDYRKLPPGKPDAWPPIEPNESRLGRFVYAGMVDRLRGLSTHVTLGRAFRARSGEAAAATPMDAWFALCREDPA
jgi:hypothetical protein